MAEQTVIAAPETASQNLVANQTATPAEATEAPATSATETPTTETPETTDKKGSEPLGDKGVEELKTQRKKRQQAEQEAAYWRGVAEAKGAQSSTQTLTQPSAQTATQPPAQTQAPASLPGEPKLENFENYDEFLIAKATFRIEHQQQQREFERKTQEIEGKFQEAIKKGQGKYSDFMEVLNNPSFRQTSAVAFAVKNSDMADDLAYYLGTHLDETYKLNTLDPLSAAREIGRIESKISIASEKPKETKKISQAPEPVKTVKAQGSPVVDENSLSTSDWIMRRNSEKFPKRKG